MSWSCDLLSEAGFCFLSAVISTFEYEMQPTSYRGETSHFDAVSWSKPDLTLQTPPPPEPQTHLNSVPVLSITCGESSSNTTSGQQLPAEAHRDSGDILKGNSLMHETLLFNYPGCFEATWAGYILYQRVSLPQVWCLLWTGTLEDGRRTRRKQNRAFLTSVRCRVQVHGPGPLTPAQF